MRVAHFGTFDVDNYGDLLFPHVAEWRLAGWSLSHVSPTGAATSFSDSRPSLSTEEASRQSFDLYLVGGGNIVNAQLATLAPYREVAREAYAGLWLGAAQQAAAAGSPLVFNAPSISKAEPAALERRLLRDAVSAAGYAAFRDEVSRRVVNQAETRLVPDTAFEIARVWPQVREESMPAPGSIAVHVNRRYLGSMSSVASVIDELAGSSQGPVRVVPIGPCHGDVETAKALVAAMSTPARVEAVTTVRAMAEAIAASELYIGSSMHGFITALSYGRRARLVLNDKPMHKFHGVLGFAGLPTTAIAPSWESLRGAEPLGYSLGEQARLRIYDALDQHWKRVIEAANGPATEASRLVRNWRRLVPLAQVESVAQRAGRKLVRTVSSARG